MSDAYGQYGASPVISIYSGYPCVYTYPCGARTSPKGNRAVIMEIETPFGNTFASLFLSLRFLSFPPSPPSPRFFVSFRFTFASFIRVPRNHLANKGENDIGGKIARVRLDDTIFHGFFSTDDPHRGNIVRLSSVLSTDLHETCFNSNRSTQIFVYYVFYIYIYNSCFFFLILSLIDRIS